MTKKWIKIISKSQYKQQILDASIKIKNGDRQGLDIKRIIGHKDVYRFRIGDFRLIFRKDNTGITILKGGYRGDVYK